MFRPPPPTIHQVLWLHCFFGGAGMCWLFHTYKPQSMVHLHLIGTLLTLCVYFAYTLSSDHNAIIYPAIYQLIC